MKTGIQIQQENLNMLLKLMKDNPTLRVLPMVDTDVVLSDDFTMWAGEFGASEIDYIWGEYERIYFKSIDYDELIDAEIEIIGCNEELKDLTEEQIEHMADKKVENLEWEKVIVVKITIPS